MEKQFILFCLALIFLRAEIDFYNALIWGMIFSLNYNFSLFGKLLRKNLNDAGSNILKRLEFEMKKFVVCNLIIPVGLLKYYVQINSQM